MTHIPSNKIVGYGDAVQTEGLPNPVGEGASDSHMYGGESRKTSRTPALQIRAQHIVGVYGSQPLDTHSTYAVPRLFAQVLTWLASAESGARVHAICPGGAALEGVQWTCGAPPLAARGISRIKRKLFGGVFSSYRAGQLAPKQLQTRYAWKALSPRLDDRPIVLSATFADTILARQMVPEARIVYWVHSLPRLGQEQVTMEAVNVADVVVVPTRAIYRELFQIVCRDRFQPPVWVIPNHVEPSAAAGVSAQERHQIRQRYGVSDTDIAVVHVGRSPEKGLQIVEAALRLLEIKGCKLVLLAAGEKVESRYGVAPGVEVCKVGRLEPSQLSRLYQSCDFGVVPSVWWENCPLALLEMMSAGLCPIGSRVGGIQEIIAHGSNGILVDLPNDVEAWATAIGSVIEDRPRRMALGQRAQQTVAGQFSTEVFFERWQRLFSSL